MALTLSIQCLTWSLSTHSFPFSNASVTYSAMPDRAGSRKRLLVEKAREHGDFGGDLQWLTTHTSSEGFRELPGGLVGTFQMFPAPLLKYGAYRLYQREQGDSPSISGLGKTDSL